MSVDGIVKLGFAGGDNFDIPLLGFGAGEPVVVAATVGSAWYTLSREPQYEGPRRKREIVPALPELSDAELAAQAAFAQYQADLVASYSISRQQALEARKFAKEKAELRGRIEQQGRKYDRLRRQ